MDLSGLHPDESHGQYKFKMGFNGEVKETKEYTKSYRYKEIKSAKKLMTNFVEALRSMIGTFSVLLPISHTISSSLDSLLDFGTLLI